MIHFCIIPLWVYISRQKALLPSFLQSMQTEVLMQCIIRAAMTLSFILSSSISLGKKWLIGCVCKDHLQVKKKVSAQGLHYSVCLVCSFRSLSWAHTHTAPSVARKINKTKWIFTSSKENVSEVCLWKTCHNASCNANCYC